MKHILLLTDFSENSKNAIDYALQLFKNDQCVFYAVHVQKPSSYISDDLLLAGEESLYETIVKKSKNELKKIINTFEGKYDNKNHHFETIIDYNVFTDALKQIIKSKKIDLIVMGSNGVTGAKEVVFGSNTINVIRKVSCPTLIIPQDFMYRKPKNILLPLDANDTLSGNAFKTSLNFIENNRSNLHILRILPNGEVLKENDTETITSSLQNINSKYFKVNGIPMDYAIDFYFQTNKIDMLMLLVQKESFFERIFKGSFDAKISNTLKAPLLVFHI